jgi:uncharacterized protein YndB with AHSA1/START domain
MSNACTSTTRFIRAPRESVFHAFADPDALVEWLVPGEMTARIHGFDFRPGGGYAMSLFYPSSEPELRGKTASHEDRYTARYLEVAPPTRIVQAITFDTDDPAFMGEMIMTAAFEERDGGTLATIAFENVPPGIRPEENDAGTRSSLEKLARLVEQTPSSPQATRARRSGEAPAPQAGRETRT